MSTSKYKLIKNYPGGPKLGTVIIKIAGMKVRYSIDRYCYWHVDSPENYPEFWEEVVEYTIGTIIYNSLIDSNYIKKEDGWYYDSKTAYTDEMITKSSYISVVEDKFDEKDYEILNYIHNGSKHIWKQDSQLKNTFCLEDGKSPFTRLEDILKYPKIYLIHSVKRLSDSEIFTVGDKITHAHNKPGVGIITRDYKIEKIYFIKENRLSFYVGEGLSLGINSIKKQPLFTTEDGVDMFEGDEFYMYTTPYNDKTRTNIFKQVATYHYNNCTQKSFSTRESAEEYIFMNKPCLSANDVMRIGIGEPLKHKTVFLEQLKYLAKQKTNEK